MNGRKLILASASPQRKTLLRRLEVPFTVLPSRVRETNPATVNHKQSRELVVGLAMRKAKAIARTVKNQRCAVLGADTLVVCKGKIFGKPKNQKHARAMLGALSGSWQTVITGLCLIRTPEWTVQTDYAETRLKFKKILPEVSIGQDDSTRFDDYTASGNRFYGIARTDGAENIDGRFCNACVYFIPGIK